MKLRRISNQSTYKPRSYKFSKYRHKLHKVRNQSLEYKVITTQVQTEVAKANSFKATHTFSSDTMPVGSHLQQKHQTRDME